MTSTRILVVEDETIVARDVRNSLSTLGYEVSGQASSGEEAIRKAGDTQPDLVLMDIRLRGAMDGVEAAERIRESYDIPVIYLTAYADEEILRRARVTEPFGYILKPFDDRELHGAIQMALYRHQMERKLVESQEWLSTTLKSIADAVIATDRSGRVTFINPTAQALTGWVEDRAVGRPVSEVLTLASEGTDERARDPVAQVMGEGGVAGPIDAILLRGGDGARIPIEQSVAPIRNERGEVIGGVLVFRDVGERRRAEEALRTARMELEKRVGERTAELARANAAMKEQIVERERVEKDLREIRYHLEELVEQRTAELTSAVQQLEAEVAERRRTEGALRESQERFRSAFDGAAIGMALVAVDGRLLQVNNSLCSMLGYAKGGLVGTSLRTLTYPDDLELGTASVRRMMAGEVRSAQVEKRYSHKLGHVVWVLVNASVVRDEQDQPLYLVIQFQDVTERKRAQDQLEASLKEKEALLKEIHHRVKNNLQVISSLLNLQAEFSEDHLALETLNQTRNRVRSMALIHEKLYQSGDLARIDFAEYLQGLTGQLFRAYALDASALAIVVEVSDILLGIDEAIPCGLIVNELVSNSLKHAFPALRGEAGAIRDPPGEIRICLRLDEEGKYSFAVSDNGIGFPKGLDFRNTPSLGLQLVTMLVEQLQGSIELRRDGGTEFRIVFPA